jgi:hypothetical protein
MKDFQAPKEAHPALQNMTVLPLISYPYRYNTEHGFAKLKKKIFFIESLNSLDLNNFL